MNLYFLDVAYLASLKGKTVVQIAYLASLKGKLSTKALGSSKKDV